MYGLLVMRPLFLGHLMHGKPIVALGSSILVNPCIDSRSYPLVLQHIRSCLDDFLMIWQLQGRCPDDDLLAIKYGNWKSLSILNGGLMGNLSKNGWFSVQYLKKKQPPKQLPKQSHLSIYLSMQCIYPSISIYPSIYSPIHISYVTKTFQSNRIESIPYAP